MVDITITEKRVTLANDALYEITLISQALRDHVSRYDNGGEIVLIARGMLARVQALSEAVSAVLIGDDGPDLCDDEQLSQIVLCGCASALPLSEVDHG